MARLVPSLALALVAVVSQSLAADAVTQPLSIETTRTTVAGPCAARVSRTLQLCEASGECRRLALGDDLDFEVPKGGAFVVTASVSYEQGGVIYGDAASDRFDRVADGERFEQRVATGEGCSLSWSYEFHVR